ncbi:hypothetical protein EDB83DRAFT_2320181 [Lactarius deliciosus]|nr:hypothetical protein EDB83DRAFT_2320181 [Lactarius deliciosus]
MKCDILVRLWPHVVALLQTILYAHFGTRETLANLNWIWCPSRAPSAGAPGLPFGIAARERIGGSSSTRRERREKVVRLEGIRFRGPFANDGRHRRLRAAVRDGSDDSGKGGELRCSSLSFHHVERPVLRVWVIGLWGDRRWRYQDGRRGDMTKVAGVRDADRSESKLRGSAPDLLPKLHQFGVDATALSGVAKAITMRTPL